MSWFGELVRSPPNPCSSIVQEKSAPSVCLKAHSSSDTNYQAICVGLLLSAKAGWQNTRPFVGYPAHCSPLDSVLFLNPAETGVSPLCLWSSPESPSTHEHRLTRAHSPPHNSHIHRQITVINDHIGSYAHSHIFLYTQSHTLYT